MFVLSRSQVDRESRIISDAYPYIASRLLTDSAPELQSALQQLLFKDGKPRWAVVSGRSTATGSRVSFERRRFHGVIVLSMARSYLAVLGRAFTAQ